jgi:hypothetical protein
MSKHTPGPWATTEAVTTREVDGYETTACAVNRADVGQAIALVYAGFGDGPANARLIAAAPELLEALKDLFTVAQANGWAEDARYMRARRAIAKAEGQ